MDKKTTFWNSFLLGFILGISSLYLLGTKEGRNKLRHLLDTLENQEEIIEKLENLVEEAKKSSSSLGTLLQKLNSKANL